MLYDVAVPDELAGRVELRPHACDLARIRNYGVLETVFPRLGRPGYRSGNDLNLLVVLVHDDILPIDDLKYDLGTVASKATAPGLCSSSSSFLLSR